MQHILYKNLFGKIQNPSKYVMGIKQPYIASKNVSKSKLIRLEMKNEAFV
jgi:hypothetical protein